MYSIHLLEVIFTGKRHNHYSVCNKTITSFCICEYEFLFDLQNKCTFISCWWGTYANVFSLLTEEFHIPWGWLHFHISWTCMLLMKPRKHIHVQYCWQAYAKFIGTLSQTFKIHIYKCSRKIVPKAFHRQCCIFWGINTVFYSFFYYFSLGHTSIMYNHCYRPVPWWRCYNISTCPV